MAVAKCFMFDFSGELIKEYKSVSAAAKETGITRSTIDGSIQRKSIVQSKFYFSTTKEFLLPKKKHEMNPLFRKHLPHHIKQ